MKTRTMIVVVVLFSLVAAAPLFAGGKQEAAAPAEEKHTIVFWMHDSPQTTAFIKDQMIPEYESKNPGIQIENQFVPHKDYEVKLITALTGGIGPHAYDIGDWLIQAYQEKGLLDSINYKAFGFSSLQSLEKAWWPSSLGGFKMKGGIYGIPMEYNTFSLFVNREHFSEIGLDAAADYPKTWRELGEIGSKLVKKDSNGRFTREAFDWPYLGSVWTLLTLEPLINQNRGNVVNSDGSPNIDSKEVIDALATYKGLIWEYGTGDPAVGISSGTNPNADFNAGDLSMWITGPWAQPLITDMHGKYDVVPLPQTEGGKESTILYAWAWVVNGMAEDKNKEKAWHWLNFLSSNQVGFLTECGYLQPRIGWEDTKEFKEFPFMQVFYDDMANGKFMFRSNKWAELGEIMDRAVQKAVKSNEDPGKVLKAAQAEAEKIM